MSDKNRKSVAADTVAAENAGRLYTPTARDQDGHKLAKGAFTRTLVEQKTEA